MPEPETKDPKAPATGEPTPEAAPAAPAAPSPEDVAAQADNPDAVKRALQAERDAAKAAKKEADELRARVQEFEDRDKSDLDKAASRAERAEAAASEATAKLLRLEVALDKKVPSDLVEFLTGSTKEELEAKADTLLKHVKTDDDGGATPPAGSFDGGARPPQPTKSVDEQIVEATAKGEWDRVDALNAQKLAQLHAAQAKG